MQDINYSTVESLKSMSINFFWKNHTHFQKKLKDLPSDLIEEILLNPNKTNNLINLCKHNENIALFVLQNVRLRDKLGKCNQEYLIKQSEKNYTNKIDVNSPTHKFNSGEFLYEICNAHSKTKQYVLNNINTFKALLSPMHLNDIYNEYVDIRANTCHFTY
jgi:hypothetical protein